MAKASEILGLKNYNALINEAKQLNKSDDEIKAIIKTKATEAIQLQQQDNSQTFTPTKADDGSLWSSFQKGATETAMRTTQLYNGLAEGTGFDLTNKSEDAKVKRTLDYLEQSKEHTSKKGLTKDRLDERTALEQKSQNAEGIIDNISVGVEQMADVVTNPDEWTAQGIVAGVFDPLNALSLGTGGLAGLFGKTLVQKVAIGATAGAVEGGTLNSIGEYVIAKGAGKSDDEANKIALQSFGGGVAMGTVMGGAGGAMTGVPNTTKTVDLKDKSIDDILSNDLLKTDEPETHATAYENLPAVITPDDIVNIDTRIKRVVDEQYKKEVAGQGEYPQHPLKNDNLNFRMVYDNLPATLKELVEVEVIGEEVAKQIEYKTKLIALGNDEIISSDLVKFKADTTQLIVNEIHKKQIQDMSIVEQIGNEADIKSKELTNQLIQSGADVMTIKDTINQQLIPHKTESKISNVLNDGLPIENRFSGLRLRKIALNTIEAGGDDPVVLMKKLSTAGVSEPLNKAVVQSIINKDINVFDEFVTEKLTNNSKKEDVELKKTIEEKIISNSELEQLKKDNVEVPAKDEIKIDLVHDGINYIKHEDKNGKYDLISEDGNSKITFLKKRKLTNTFKKDTYVKQTKTNSNTWGEYTAIELESNTKKESKSKPVKKEKVVKSTKKPEKDIQDFGDKIGGARKDFASKSMSIQDLADMNEMEANKLVVKKNLWKPLDYKALKEDGYSPESASYIKRVKDAIPTQAINSKDAQGNYINFVNDIKEIILSSNKDVETIAKNINDYITKEFKQLNEAGEPYGGMRTWNDKSKLYSKQGIISNKLMKKIALTIYKDGYYRERFGKYGGVDKDWSKMIKETGSRKIDPNIKQLPKREYLSEIKRDGKDWRKGKDIDEKILQNTFNFKAGEFGNWVNQKERQSSLNHAFDGLMDLAEVLEIDPKTISLNGELSIAFGSRGKGSALAHYEPARVVINLTKIKGAGSLAHEWLHALDNYIGKMGKEIQTTKGIYASDISTLGSRYDRATMKKYLPSEGINIDLVESFKNLSEVINKKKLSADEIIIDRKGTIKYKQDQIAKYNNYFKKAKRSEGYKKANSKNIPYWKEYLDRDKKRIIEIEQEILNVEAGDYKPEYGNTSFTKNAKQLDGKKSKPYWNTTIELTARAFEAYIFDTAKRSDYLVAGVQDGKYSDTKYTGDPYPAGQERININKAFADLMETIRGDSLKGFEKVDISRFDDAMKNLEEC